MASARDISRISRLDDELVTIIKDFAILMPLSWSMEVQKKFLRGAKQCNWQLPQVSYAAQDYRPKIEQLKLFLKKLGSADHPALQYLRETAQSYLYAYYILQNPGTKKVSEYSRRLYGSPSDKLPGYERENYEVASYFLRVVDQYHLHVPDEPLIYSSAKFRSILQDQVGSCIDPVRDPITITVDPHITARAAAGSNYVKIRKNARFSEADLMQLLHHEVYTHTLTYINGRKQKVLQSMGYASPRTTATQEGLAVFSEYINLSIELVRLKRIALRIIAIHMAENGADFLDLYHFFHESGQNEEESYLSAMRIFRGGDPKGGIVFYKDNVYLRGLIEVEGFLKRVMHQGLVHNIDVLFAGKMTTGDVLLLQPLIDEGFVVPPAYMPEWATKRGELAAHLAFNDLTERFKIKRKRKGTL